MSFEVLKKTRKSQYINFILNLFFLLMEEIFLKFDSPMYNFFFLSQGYWIYNYEHNLLNLKTTLNKKVNSTTSPENF